MKNIEAIINQRTELILINQKISQKTINDLLHAMSSYCVDIDEDNSRFFSNTPLFSSEHIITTYKQMYGNIDVKNYDKVGNILKILESKNSDIRFGSPEQSVHITINRINFKSLWLALLKLGKEYDSKYFGPIHPLSNEYNSIIKTANRDIELAQFKIKKTTNKKRSDDSDDSELILRKKRIIYGKLTRKP